MSDTTPTEAAEMAVEATEAVPAPEASDGDAGAADGATTGDDGNPNRESAKYRTKLRAAEAELAAVTARLETLQRAEAERLAASVLSDPADLWRDGAELAAMLDGAGHVDPGKVTEVVKGLVAAHPHWRQPARRPATMDGQRSGATGLEVGTTMPLWRDVLATAD